MEALQQQLLEQAGPYQCLRRRRAEAQCAWTCNYRPEDDRLSAPKHGYFLNVSVALDMHETGRDVYLDVQTDVRRVNPEVLCNAVVRVVVQDTRGTELLLWESDAIDQMYLLDSEISHFMRISILMPSSLLKWIEKRGPHHVQCILAHEQGDILDSVSGKIVIRAA